MKFSIAIVHNSYGKLSGEEIVIDNLVALLKARGISISRFSRSSTEIGNTRLGKISAFFSGIHNPFAKKEFEKFLKDQRPDVVHIHNLYPLISPSILPVCKKLRIPVVMTIHNFRLACPNGLLLSKGEICHRCLGRREYWCILRNCEDSIFKSTGYALRTAAARVLRRYFDNISHFICLSEFQKNILVNEGLPADRVSVMANPLSLSVLPRESRNLEKNTGSPIEPFGDDKGGGTLGDVRGMVLPRGHHGPTGTFGDDSAEGLRVHPPSIPPIKGGKNADDSAVGRYVAYVGRVSREKGIATLFEAARLCPDIPFIVAGSWQAMPEARELAPNNVTLLGAVPSDKLGPLYENARLFVLPSVWYEGFPTVLLEAMSHGLPIVCSRIGGLPEIVEEGLNGLLYEPGNAKELAARIKTLWEDAALCKKFGDSGRQKLNAEYNAEKLMDKLILIYEKVIAEKDRRCLG